MKYFFLSLAIFAFVLGANSVRAELPLVNLSGYIDAYVAKDNDLIYGTDMQTQRQLTYVNPYKDQLGLNLAQLTVEASYKSVRGVFALQTGDFATTAWGATKNKTLQQANIGFNIYDKIWIDAGYFLTHIGGESVLPKDNWLSSHSIVTYFEPFFQSGIRASYEGDKLTAQIHILNANGLYEDNNDNKTYGVFLGYKITDDFSVSYANVIGNEEPEGYISKTLMYHNFVAQYNLSKDIILKGQLDYATKEKVVQDPTHNEASDGTFMGASLTGHYQMTSQFGGTLRFAYVDNEDAVFAPTMKGMAFTLGCEYKPSDNSYIRLEGSMYSLDDKYKLFYRDGKADNAKIEFILNFGLILK